MILVLVKYASMELHGSDKDTKKGIGRKLNLNFDKHTNKSK
jgi:hypothetical protein